MHFAKNYEYPDLDPTPNELEEVNMCYMHEEYSQQCRHFLNSFVVDRLLSKK